MGQSEGGQLPGLEGQLIGSEVREIYDPPEQSCVCQGTINHKSGRSGSDWVTVHLLAFFLKVLLCCFFFLHLTTISDFSDLCSWTEGPVLVP